MRFVRLLVRKSLITMEAQHKGVRLMGMNNNARLKVTENLLTLERGSDELMLTDYVDLRPLYIGKGKDYVKNFLRAIPELKTYKNITTTFPQETALLDMLVHHGIVVPH